MRNTTSLQPSPALNEKKRYALLDELRGFMVLCMVVYHWLLSLYDIFSLETAGALFDFFTPVEPFFAGGFVLLSGLMCGFSRSNIRRGGLLCLIALGVTGVTVLSAPYVGQIQIYFGILHLLGVSMLFCGLLDPLLRRVNRWVGLLLNLLLFFLFYGLFDPGADLIGINTLLPAAWKQNPWLFPIGITTPDFFSADYFPILPWIFMFLCGYYLYRFHLVERHEAIFYPRRIPALAFLGRHALIVYLVHQPLIYLVCLPFLL